MTRRRTGNLPPGTGRRSRVGGQSEICLRSIEGRFEPDERKCGDRIHLHADARNIPNGTPVDFMIFDYRSDRCVDHVSGRIQNLQVRDATWDSQKEDNQWHAPHLYFIVESYGEVGRSDNMFSFHRYEDISPTDIDRAFDSTPCAVHEDCAQIYRIEQLVKIQLDDRVFKIHVPIKVRKRSTTQPLRGAAESYGDWWARCQAVPLEGEGNLTAADKTTLKENIEAYFRQKKALHRRQCTRGNTCTDRCERKCCKLEIQVLVHFYDIADRTSASMVEFWKGSGRADAKNWFEDDTMNVLAHEVGHLMGFYDEYVGGGVGAAPWQHPNPGRLMCDVQAGLENYYFDFYADWLGNAARTDEPWDVVDYT
jgi:hypothetical protein